MDDETRERPIASSPSESADAEIDWEMEESVLIFFKNVCNIVGDYQ